MVREAITKLEQQTHPANAGSVTRHKCAQHVASLVKHQTPRAPDFSAVLQDGGLGRTGLKYARAHVLQIRDRGVASEGDRQVLPPNAVHNARPQKWCLWVEHLGLHNA